MFSHLPFRLKLPFQVSTGSDGPGSLPVKQQQPVKQPLDSDNQSVLTLANPLVDDQPESDGLIFRSQSSAQTVTVDDKEWQDLLWKMEKHYTNHTGWHCTVEVDDRTKNLVFRPIDHSPFKNELINDFVLHSDVSHIHADGKGMAWKLNRLPSVREEYRYLTYNGTVPTEASERIQGYWRAHSFQPQPIYSQASYLSAGNGEADTHTTHLFLAPGESTPDPPPFPHWVRTQDIKKARKSMHYTEVLKDHSKSPPWLDDDDWTIVPHPDDSPVWKCEGVYSFNYAPDGCVSHSDWRLQIPQEEIANMFPSCENAEERIDRLQAAISKLGRTARHYSLGPDDEIHQMPQNIDVARLEKKIQEQVHHSSDPIIHAIQCTPDGKSYNRPQNHTGKLGILFTPSH